MIKVAQIFNFHPGLFSSNFHHQGGSGATCKGSYNVGHFNMVVETPQIPKSVHWWWFYPQYTSGIIFLVPVLATKEALALLVYHPFMSERFIWTFRHFECHNLSIISDVIDSWGGCKICDGRRKDLEGSTEQCLYYISLLFLLSPFKKNYWPMNYLSGQVLMLLQVQLFFIIKQFENIYSS